MVDPVEVLLGALRGVRPSGDGRWTAFCPAHEDRRGRSLGVKVTQDGTVLVRCFAGCSADSIVGSVGLTLSDLFPKPDRSTHGTAKPPRFRASELLEVAAFEVKVVALAASDIVAGRELTRADFARIVRADEALSAILREISSR